MHITFFPSRKQKTKDNATLIRVGVRTLYGCGDRLDQGSWFFKSNRREISEDGVRNVMVSLRQLLEGAESERGNNIPRYVLVVARRNGLQPLPRASVNPICEYIICD